MSVSLSEIIPNPDIRKHLELFQEYQHLLSLGYKDYFYTPLTRDTPAEELELQITIAKKRKFQADQEKYKKNKKLLEEKIEPHARRIAQGIVWGMRKTLEKQMYNTLEDKDDEAKCQQEEIINVIHKVAEDTLIHMLKDKIFKS